MQFPSSSIMAPTLPADLVPVEPTPFEAAEAIVHLLTNVKEMVIASFQENVDRAKIQADIDAALVDLQDLAAIAGYDDAPLPMSLDVQTEAGRIAAAEQIEASIQSAIELANTLGGDTPPEPIPEPSPIEAAEAIIDHLTDIKALTITALAENVDLDKVQTDIDAHLFEISKLAPIAGYDGVSDLPVIDVFDPASIEAALEQIDAEIMSVIELLEDLQTADEDQFIQGTPGDDNITTGSGDDDVQAGRGDDFVFGGAGDDDLSGGRGADVIDGGDGDDALRGGHGDDVLTGGAGDDDMCGGKGDDAFVFEAALGHDRVLDFDAQGDDTLVFVFDDDAFSGWTSEDILGAASQQGRHVVIDFEDTGDSVTLMRTDLSDLRAADIDVFVHV